MIWFYIAITVIGLLILIKASDYFVDNAAWIAKALGVSEFIIGLTLVAVGTSLPELASSIMAVINSVEEIAIGNIIGSNIANIGLIVGITAVLSMIKTRKIMFQRDSFILIFISLIFYVFALDLNLSRIEGLVLLLLFIIYILYLSEEKLNLKKEQSFSDFIDYMFKLRMIRTIKNHSRIQRTKNKKERKELLKKILITVLSLIGVFFGGYLLIKGATIIATEFGLTKTFIGLTLVAVGTSLPELMVSLSAVRKGFSDIMIGNIIGSNIANITLVLGTTLLIKNIKVNSLIIEFMLPYMLLTTLILAFFIGSRKEIRRIGGIFIIILYLIFIYYSYINALL